MTKQKKKIASLYGTIRKMSDMITELRASRDGAYRERNKVVAAVSKLYPSCLGLHDTADKAWNKEWMNIVYIRLLSGQVSWHLHDSDLPLFAHLDYENEKWDGHTTEEKYERLANLV